MVVGFLKFIHLLTKTSKYKSLEQTEKQHKKGVGVIKIRYYV